MSEPLPMGGGGWPQPWLRDRLGLQVSDLALYARALTHRSADGRHNERLEFLGDAVLNLVVAQYLYDRFPAADEGSLSRLRASVVSERPLAAAGTRIGIGRELRLGSGELRTGGFRRESILADAVEALIGARYLEAGLRAATLLVQQVLAPELEAVDPSALAKDAKTRLQELLQGRGGGLPVYTLLAAEGEPHAQTFTVQCEVELPRRVAERRGAGADAALLCTEGSGSSRRRAEQQAAERILAQLQQPGESP